MRTRDTHTNTIHHTETYHEVLFRRCKIITLHALCIVFIFVLFFPACITCHFRHCLHIFWSSFQEFIIHYLLFTTVHYFVRTHAHTHTHTHTRTKLTLSSSSGCSGPTDHRPSHITRFIQPPAGFVLCSCRKFVPSKCLFLSHKHHSMASFIWWTHGRYSPLHVPH